MKKNREKIIINTGFTLAIGILLIIGFVSYQRIIDFTNVTDSVSKTYKILERLERLSSLLKDTESGRRGYIITGEERFLDIAYSGINLVDDAVKELRQLLSDNSEQQKMLDDLEPLITKRLDLFKQSIESQKSKGFIASFQIPLIDEGKIVMDKIQEIILEIKKEERNLLKLREKVSKGMSQKTILTLFIGSGLSFSLLLLVFYILKREIFERKRTEQALRKIKDELEIRVDQRAGELKKAYEELKKAEQVSSQLAAIVNFSDDAIIGNTLEGIITSWNVGAEKVYGYHAEEVIGKHISLLVPPEFSNEIPRIREKLRSGESISHFETIRTRKDGKRICVSLTFSPIKDDAGAVIGLSSIDRDVTERKKLDKLKDDFISTVSHELRTPLSITKEGISLVLDKIPGDINEKQKKILTTSRDNIDRLSRIINELLDISKIEEGKIDVKRESVSIVELIARAISLFESKAKEKGLALEFLRPEKDLHIYIDADKITQVLTNLLDNAIRFTKEGVIKVYIIDKENEAECIVEDSGVGISQDDLSRVFNKFQQFGRVPGAGEKGTGLGLAIAKGIIEMHKGKIWVDSEFEKGSKFGFSLPKYTYQTLAKECVSSGLNNSLKNNSKFSIIMGSMANFNNLVDELSAESIRLITKDIESIIRNSLRRSGDTTLKDKGEFIVFLADCDKENALRIEGRLEQLIDDYLVTHNLSTRIQLKFNCATYPDDAKDENGLLEAVRENI